MLDEQERSRYSRQLLLPELGEAGQEKLKQGRVLLIGAGGLGSPAALYLAAAGVGVLGICDGDVVEPSNLNRQILHGTGNLGQAKTSSAKASLTGLNPDIQVIAHNGFVTPESIQELIAPYDFILDCTDSFAAKFMINDACTHAGKAFCHAGIGGFSGQLMTWLPGIGAPCFRCIFREAPKGPQNRSVMGAIAGVVGCLQAMEAIKFIAGIGKPLTGTLLSCDALEGEFLRVKLPSADANCPACGGAALAT